MTLTTTAPRLALPAALLGLLLALLPGPARGLEAAEAAMEALIARVSANLDTLYQQRQLGDRAAVAALIRAEILPQVDQERFTRRVFRHYWPRVVEAGREQEAQSRVLTAILRTYTATLSDYAGDTIDLISVTPQGKRTVAKTRLRRADGQTLQIDFSLVETAGEWRIDDMAVDGMVVSLTLFHAVKSVWERRGMDEALESVAAVDVHREALEAAPAKAETGATPAD